MKSTLQPLADARVGFEVLRSLRVSKVKTPILILTGLAGIEDKVSGLGFGADDYGAKATGHRVLSQDENSTRSPYCIRSRDSKARA